MGYEVLYGSINIDQVPEEAMRVFPRKDGTEGMSFNFKISPMKQPDNYGNTHTVTLYMGKQHKGEPSVYIGKAKRYTYDNQRSNYGHHHDDNDQPF